MDLAMVLPKKNVAWRAVFPPGHPSQLDLKIRGNLFLGKNHGV
jgi:hypothetical protein